MGTYYFDGITTSDQDIHENLGGPLTKYYGNSLKRLVYRADEDPPRWQIYVGSGLVPEFYKEPAELTEEKFREEMIKLGVSSELLGEFFSTEGGFSEAD